jgi:hypothetical protein
VALRFSDRFLLAPAPQSAEQAAELTEEFTPAELTELALGLGLFHGFSKVLIGLQLEPDGMETTVYPTPGYETPTPELTSDDAHVRVLAASPALAARWSLTYEALWRSGNIDPAMLEVCRERVAQLLGIEWAETRFGTELPTEADLDALLTLSELFVIDARAIEPELVATLRSDLGEAGLMTLMVGLALWDGIYRVALTIGAPT